MYEFVFISQRDKTKMYLSQQILSYHQLLLISYHSFAVIRFLDLLYYILPLKASNIDFLPICLYGDKKGAKILQICLMHIIFLSFLFKKSAVRKAKHLPMEKVY